MTTLKTKQNELVLKEFYPEEFDRALSKQIYQSFVGIQVPNNKLFVVVGTDSGLLVDYLASIATTGQRFVFIDFPEVIEHIQSTRSALFSENSSFKAEFHSFNTFEFEWLYEGYQDYVVRNAVIILSSLMGLNNRGTYCGVDAEYKEKFLQFRIDRVDNYDFKKVFDQQIESACDLRYPLPVIEKALAGDIPAIILGGGPSLDKVIPWLKEHQQKIWIFAASRICKRLLKEGITPDIIGTFDGQPLIFEYSKEMYAFEKSSILVTGEHPYAPLIRQWSGLKTYTRRRFPWVRGAEEHIVSDGPTVTNALFSISGFLGVSCLYLAGVDFCFTPEGVCHESGSIESKTQQRDASDVKTLNYRGEAVSTNIQLYDARNSFEAQVKITQEKWPDFRVYNLNNGAAVIEGVDYTSFSQIVLGLDKFDLVEALAPKLQWDADSEKKYQLFLKGEIKSHNKWLFQIAKEAKKGLQLTSTLFVNERNQASKIKTVLKLKTKLEKLLGVDYQTMVNYGYQAFMETLKPVESEQDMSQQEMESALKGFFSGLLFATEGFLKKLEELREEVTFRLMELDPNSGFLSLSDTWLEQKIPGRFHVWLEHIAPHDYSYYRKHFVEKVTVLEEAFEQLKTDETALEHAFKQRLNSQEDFIFRLNQAFEAGDVEAVQVINRQLILMSSTEHRIASRLATGMLLEFKGSAEDALIHYLTVDPSQKYFCIQQQLFPLAFLLKQPEKGLRALNALSLMNIKYLPKYAEALEVLGDVDSAVAVYRAYPLLYEDTVAIIQLIRLLVQQQNIEAANALLQKAEASEQIDQLKLQSFVDSLNEKSESH